MNPGLVNILREAAEIISNIDPQHAPANIRWPISDELHGFAGMVEDATEPSDSANNPGTEQVKEK